MVVLLTGANGGIGLATLKLLATHKDLYIYASVRRKGALAQANVGENIQEILIDMNDQNSIKTAIEQIKKEKGGIDILINNAGYGLYGAVESIPTEQACEQMQVNFNALAQLCHLCLPHMRRQKSGLIINISSVAGRVGMSFGAYYHASKHAVEGFSESLRMEMRGYGVQVCVVAPGAIDTPWWDNAQKRLFEASNGSTYSQRAQSIARAAKAMLKRKNFSSADCVGKAISKQVERFLSGKSVATRVCVGFGSHFIPLAKALTPTRLYDYFVEKIVKA